MIKQIIEVARRCGLVMKNAHASDIKIKRNDPKNLVTEYDTKIQEILKCELLNIIPEASFFGEEGEHNFSKDGFCFICDPIDGTTNFVKDLKHSAISIALLKDGIPFMGIIYNPYLDEMFWAEKGKGAFCNGEKICTSKEALENSIIVFGTSPYNSSLHSKTWKLAEKSLKIALDVRRSGSAVLDLADVAMGRFGIYWEFELQPWDYAAGFLIAKEAGAIITNINNNEIIDFFKPTSIVAMANEKCDVWWK